MTSKKPVIVVTHPETMEMYRALPLWDEHVDIYPISDPPHNRLDADIVIIDSGFDDEHGLDMLRKVKQEHPDVPVIFVTDAGSEDTAIEAFRLGAKDYLKKPLSLFGLRDHVAKFLSLKRTSWGKRLYRTPDIIEDVTKKRQSGDNNLPANLLRVLRFLKENFAQAISVDQMAHEAGFSKCHFCREFKKTTGMKPTHFLSFMRVERSKLLLRKNLRLPVSSIAMKVGFNDLSSFNRHFRRLTGLTPTAYRNSFRNTDESHLLST